MKRALLSMAFVACTPTPRLPPQAPLAALALVLDVEGSRLRADGREVILAGVNLSGSEFRCIKGDGIFDGPDANALVEGLASWNINAVRVPLNESCWLGDARLSPDLSGEKYRSAIAARVHQFRARGWFVVLDLHWSSVGTELANGIAAMPHAERAPQFWASVAHTFRGDLGVLFDLYNEPHIANLAPDAAWRCWRDGCTLDSRPVAGMQALANAVRGEGARNIILVSGLNWSNDFSQWVAYRPKLDRVAISFHTYNFNGCNTPACWKSAPSDVPIVMTEFGENDCGSAFAREAIGWAKDRGASFFAWTWNPWDCKLGPALIEKWDGTPTPYGHGVRELLKKKPTGP